MNQLITFIILYTVPMIFCIIRGKIRRDVFTAKLAFIPLLNLLAAGFELEEMYNAWIEK